MSRLNNTNGVLLSALNNNTPFVYAHLVKFERPIAEGTTNVSVVNGTNGDRFAYITDAGYDITWDDGTTYINASENAVANGNRTYVANKLIKTGGVTESTRVKVDGLNIEIDATAIDTEVTSHFTVTSTEIQGQKGVDLALAGFSVGDKIRFTDNASSELIVTGFKGDGQGGGIGNRNARITYTTLSGTQATFSNTEKTLTLLSEETNFLTDSTLSTSFVNRQVIVYKAFFYADNPHTLIGNPIKLFEGIITAGNYKESQKGASISWALKSHWGDFEQTRGRITSADFHQALDQNENPQKESTLKKAYAEDYGFAHSEIALNVIATYQDIDIQLKEKKKKKWYGATKYKYKEVEVEVTRETDLRFDLQARRIPLIYGVVRTKPIPVFADIGASPSTNNEVFTAHVLSEGPIQSIMNIYVDDMPLVCIDEADATARSTGSEAVDIKCTGRTDAGNVLSGATADISGADLTFQQSDEYYSLLSENPTSGLFRGHMIVKAQQAHAAALAKAYVDPPTSSFQAAQSGIIHEKVIKFTDPEDWYLEFHGGYEDQVASRLISTQANTTGKKFRVQEDYWTPAAGSGIEYWGPKHQLLDTAYAAIKFELSADQTTLPNLEYVVKGKMIECYNYDGSYEHNNLVTYNAENITNFVEGDTVTIKTRRGFTASSDAGGATYSANDTIAASKTIIELFYFVDGRGETHWRMRWDLTGQEQDIINEAKDFYVVKGSNTWSMITYDGTATIDTNITVAEVLTTTVSSPSSSGSANYAATRSSQSSNFDAATDQGDALFRFFDLHEGGGDSALDRYFYSQGLNGSRSSTTLTFNTINSTKAADVTTVIITNKIKLSSNASSTNDYYNGMTIVVSRRLANGNEYSVKKKIEDYDGSTRIATLTEEFLEFKPEVGDKVEIKFTKDIVSETAGNDVRPSTNFAMILLDYISSKTYGPGIDVNTKIDLDTFRLAGQMCDTQSDVTVKFASSVSLTAGDVYRRFENNHEKWRGTVKTTASGTSHVFTNVTGKLSNKFNNYAYRNIGDIVYTKNGTDLYRVTTAGVQSSISNNAGTLSSPTIRKVSGSGASTLTMVGHGTGNPVTNYSFYDSDDVKFWKYLGWEEQRQKYVTRHQGNIKLDTNQTVFQIIQGLLEHFNGQLAFVDGQYRLTVESTRTADELDNVFNDTVGGNSPTVADLDIRARYITDDDIIGNIAIKDDGLSKSFNSLSASIADPMLNFDSRSVSFFNSEYLKADRGVVRSTNFTAGGITNYFNARMLVKQTLDKSRFNRQISFTMRPVGLSILPGEVIRIEYDRFGWKSTSPKLFRVETVSLKEDCLIGITAEEYDDSVYIIDPPTVSAFYIDTKQAAVARTPTAPSNVTVNTSGPEGANVITWTASAGLSTTGKYEVWRATSKSGNASTSVVSHATQLDFEPVTNSYTDIGFTNTSDVTYFYWVRAYNEMAQQTTSGNQQRRKKYYSDFNANSNYGGVTDASQVGRAVADGISPINITMKVASTLAAADSAGNLVLSGGQIPDSGNEIRVFEGTNAIQFDGSGTANGTFNVTISATNVTAGSIADSGSFATINPATGMSQDVGTLVFTISGKKADGTAFTQTATQSFTKAKQGIQGIQGVQGNSITGPAGLRTIQGYLYYEKLASAGSSAPSAPGGTTYNITDSSSGANDAGTVTGTSINDSGTTGVWKNSPNTQDATSTSTFWTVRYSGQESSAGSSTITVSYSNVVKQTSFTGVVTFSGGTLTDGSTDVTPLESSDVGSTGSTTIDGGRILTGQVNLGSASGMSIRQGKTGYPDANTTGFWLGNDGGTPKFSIGTSTNFLRFSGSALELAGTLKLVDGSTTTTLDNSNTLNTNTEWSDVAGTTNAPDNNATQNQTDLTTNNAIAAAETGAVTTAGTNANNADKDAGKIGGWELSASRIYSNGHRNTTLTNTSGFLGSAGMVLRKEGAIHAQQFYVNANGSAGFSGTITLGGTNLNTTNTLNANTTDADILGAGNSFGDLATKNESTVQSNTLSAAEWSDIAGTANAPDNNATNTNAPESAVHSSGSVGGWELNTSRLYSAGHATTSLSAGSGFLGSAGMVLRKEGAIHSKEFYVNENGDAGFSGNITSGGTVSAQALDLDGVTLEGGANGLKIRAEGVQTANIAANAVSVIEFSEDANQHIGSFLGGTNSAVNPYWTEVGDMWWPHSSSVDVDGFFETAFLYQWRRATATVPHADDGGKFDCIVTWHVGNVAPENTSGVRTTASKNMYGDTDPNYGGANWAASTNTLGSGYYARGYKNFSVDVELYKGWATPTFQMGDDFLIPASYSGYYIFFRTFVKINQFYNAARRIFIINPTLRFAGYKR